MRNKSNRTFGENKPKQSQFQNRSQKTEYRIQMMERIAKSGLTRDYENKSAFAVPTPPKWLRRRDRKNKPKQSQCRIGRQMTEDRRQMSENRVQIMEVYPPEAGQRTDCPAGTASNYDMHPSSAKKVLTGISCALISSRYDLYVCDCLRGILCG